MGVSNDGLYIAQEFLVENGQTSFSDGAPSCRLPKIFSACFERHVRLKLFTCFLSFFAGPTFAFATETGTSVSHAISYPESSGFLVSGGTPGRLWGHRILLPQDFCGKTMETVTEQPIKKIEFFRCPQSLPGVAPLTKKPDDSGYESVSHAIMSPMD